VIVEWPDRLKLRTDWPVLRIGLEHLSEDLRKIVVDDGRGSAAVEKSGFRG
jgi:hypothetical protein